MSNIKITVGDLCHFDNGYGFKPSDWKEQGLPIIRIQNLNGSDKFNYFTGKPKDSWTVETGDLLFAWAGVRGVSFGPTIWKGQKGVLNQHIYRIRPKKEVNIYWLYSALKIITTRIEAKAHGFKSSLLHVHKRDITEQTIPVPQLEEQQKIAAILGDWDHTIDKLEQLLTTKRTYKRGLMQQLLSGKTRFPNFKDDWQEHTFSDIFQRATRKNTEQNTNVLTISAKKGLISQTKYFNKSVSAQNLSGYYLLKNGEFAYNRSYSSGYPMGATKRLDRYETGVVSTLYLCFSLINPECDSDFMVQYFESGQFNRELSKIAQEGARNHGLLNVGVKDFFSTRLVLPSLEEQRKIAAVLQAADAEITALEQQLKAFRQQKRGLMQQLLTGKKRVKTNKQSL